MIGKYKQISRFIAKWFSCYQDEDIFNKIIQIADSKGGNLGFNEIRQLTQLGIPVVKYNITTTDKLREFLLQSYLRYYALWNLFRLDNCDIEYRIFNRILRKEV